MPLTAADLIVEDGTGLLTANSYVSLAGASAYFDRHLYADRWWALEADRRIASLIQSARMLDSFMRPLLPKLTEISGLLFPRDDLLGVPQWLKDAQCEQVLVLADTNRLIPKHEGLSSISAGGVSVSYASSAATTGDLLSPYVRSLIAPYVSVRGGIGMARLLRV